MDSKGSSRPPRPRGSASRARRLTRSTPGDFDSVEHLGPEALAAYVDNELSAVATDRARMHLVQCELCRREVKRQRQAAESLKSRDVEDLKAPPSLVRRLANIEQTCPEGPGAEELAHAEGQTLMDRVEVLYRAVKHVRRQ